MGGAVLAQGGQILITSVASAEECGAKCNAKDGCGSIMFFDYLTGSKGSNCFLYTKELDGSEPINGKIDKRFFSYFKTCVLGILKNKGLVKNYKKKIYLYLETFSWYS